jgi:hypothetical protein
LEDDTLVGWHSMDQNAALAKEYNIYWNASCGVDFVMISWFPVSSRAEVMVLSLALSGWWSKCNSLVV